MTENVLIKSLSSHIKRAMVEAYNSFKYSNIHIICVCVLSGISVSVERGEALNTGGIIARVTCDHIPRY